MRNELSNNYKIGFGGKNLANFSPPSDGKETAHNKYMFSNYIMIYYPFTSILNYSKQPQPIPPHTCKTYGSMIRISSKQSLNLKG